MPFNDMDGAQKERMQRYCSIRYGVADIAECYRLVEAARF